MVDEDPNSPTPGQPLYMITLDNIQFIHNGVSEWVGGETAGHNERAVIVAHELGAGDYTMVMNGRAFNTPRAAAGTAARST